MHKLIVIDLGLAMLIHSSFVKNLCYSCFHRGFHAKVIQTFGSMFVWIDVRFLGSSRLLYFSYKSKETLSET